MVAQNQFALGTHNRHALPNIAAAFDSDGTARRKSLVPNWLLNVFVGMVVILDEDGCLKANMTFNVNAVLRRYNRSVTYTAIVVNDNLWPLCLPQIEPRIFLKRYKIAEPDAWSNAPI